MVHTAATGSKVWRDAERGQPETRGAVAVAARWQDEVYCRSVPEAAGDLSGLEPRTPVHRP